MNTINKLGMLVTVAFAAMLTVGCSSDDGVDGTGGKPKQSINGTAAVGKAIGNASLAIKVKDGAKKQVTTNSEGKFQIDITGLEGPFLMRVEMANGGALFSIAAGGGTTNIHPFTDLIVRNWFKVQGLDIEAEFNNNLAVVLLPTVDDINDIKQAIKNIITLTLVEYSLSAELDLITTGFDADGTGFDAYLDNVQVVIINNKITIVIKDPATNIENELVSDVNLDNDFTLQDNAAPITPSNLRGIPANESEIIVVWNASTDNTGVVGYNVYRDSSLVKTTPFPVFSDVGLIQGTQYCYDVEAFDSAGNISARASTTLCPTTLAASDLLAPPSPVSLVATTLGSSAINLIWVQSDIADVAKFEIYRGASASVNEKIATVTTNSYTGFNLNSGTEYCYKVVAVDAANNASPASSEACATTDGEITLPPVNGGTGLTFSLSNYTVSEADATALITVKRGGDAREAASIDYSVADGSAIVNQDYTAVSGTLTWAANDSSDKTFLVPVKADDTSEPDETVVLNLLNESANVLLETATLTISDAVCAGTLTDNIVVDTTIAGCTTVTRNISVDTGANLTISPGATLIFQSGAGFNIRQDGSLTAQGTKAKPILLTDRDHTPGSWSGIRYTFSNNSRNVLEYVTIEYGGGINAANIVMTGSESLAQRLTIKNTTLANSGGYGLMLDSGSILTAFSNNVISGNAEGPVSLPANLVGMLDSASRYSGNTKDKLDVNSGTISVEQTWPVIDVPYSLGTHSVSAPLTVGAGSVFKFRAGGQFNITQSGALTAIGTEANNIVFTAEQQTRGYWSGIKYTFSNNINNKLDYVIVEYGGNFGTDDSGNILMVGSTSLVQQLTVTNSVSRYSDSYGFNFDKASNVSFSNNTVVNNRRGAVSLPANVVGTLDVQSTYSGNDTDVVFVENETISADMTWPAIDSAYSVGSLGVHAQLTIQAGAVLNFRSGGGFNVNNEGALFAQGSADANIIFGSENASPGFWDGILFTFSNNVNNVLDYVVIDYAGVGINGGAVKLIGSGTLISAVSITNSTIQNGGSYGIWLDTDSVVNDDIAASNVFVNNANANVFFNTQ